MWQTAYPDEMTVMRLVAVEQGTDIGMPAKKKKN